MLSPIGFYLSQQARACFEIEIDLRWKSSLSGFPLRTGGLSRLTVNLRFSAREYD
jgi:hypothetical protein